ncbi:DegV family protein [Bacillus benzoevorans]|nr:DegV family protein [Bacillus benzoevorans]
MKIAWITDSTCFIDPEFANQHHIFVIPMNISFEQETYRDGVDITEEEFYQKLTASPNLPKSSQPALGELVSLYEELKKEYDLGIAIHLSSDLSGTCNSSKHAADIAGFPLELVDSRLISLPMKYMIEKGQEMIRQGMSPADTAAKLRTMYQDNQLFFMTGSLEQLHKGGRVSALQLLMGSLLQIKPVFSFQEGKAVPFEKVRSKKRALSYMISLLQNDLEKGVTIKKVFVLSGSAAEESLILQEQIRSLTPNIEIVTGPLGSAIGVHVGAGTIAISWFRE